MRYRGTCIRVNLSAIEKNLRAVRRCLSDDTKVLAVVKANAYGHGAVPVSRTALSAGADMLGVAIPEEGEELREAGIRAPILVLGGVNGRGAEASVENGLIQTLYDAQGVEHLEAACVKAQKRAQAHLKLDTGMGRIGARTEEEVKKVLDALAKAPHVDLTGVFTHFANADGHTDDYSLLQLERFNRLCALLPRGLNRHASASAALLRYPGARFDMVRAGIVMYGCPPCADVPFELIPALSFVTEVTYVKRIEKGECVSYGCTFTAGRPTLVATLAVGYGDGYHRALSGGRGTVLIGGKRCSVLGRVCMDQIMVDVTDVPSVAEGDEAVLIGRQGGEEITADELAAACGTISYEMLLSHTARVPVEYVEE